MKKIKEPLVILMAEDDYDYFTITQHMVAQLPYKVDLRHVEDGEYLMDYLLRRGSYADPAASPAPDIIFLDLNMPRKSGLESLAEIKGSAALSRIPIIVLTIARDGESIRACCELGVDSFVIKPLGYPELVKVLNTLGFC
ncbi:MAG: response regulator [Candidatus Omnitrophota bacterium]